MLPPARAMGQATLAVRHWFWIWFIICTTIRSQARHRGVEVVMAVEQRLANLVVETQKLKAILAKLIFVDHIDGVLKEKVPAEVA